MPGRAEGSTARGGLVQRLDTGRPPGRRPSIGRGPTPRELDDVSEPNLLLSYWGVPDHVQRRAYPGWVSVYQEKETGELCSHPDGIGEVMMHFLRVPAAFATGATVAHG